MVFSSILFLFVFLPIFLYSYFLSPQKWKNTVLLVASILFYAWGAPKFVFLLLLSLLINFWAVKQLHNSKEKSHRKGYLYFSLAINLGLLAYFKYANFFIENLNLALSQLGVQSWEHTKILLPIGISFFTFQSLTYTVDVYRKTHEPLKKVGDYFLYILMFPQLIAGPIVRFNTIADQIIDRTANETADEKLLGFYRFVIGLSKKVLIANVLGEQVDLIYTLPTESINTYLSFLAVSAYSFQIYFDFSGYSDMAIGLGRMMGFRFPENFNNPYISKNITEFWRRWHITLGDWMKDYLYIPLGGNRVDSKLRAYFNLCLVFLLSGLWHGDSWNFIIWGAWHGLFLVLDRLFLKKLLQPLGRYFNILLTYFVVLIGWIFFRVETLGDALFYIRELLRFNFSPTTLTFDLHFWVCFGFAVLFAFSNAFKMGVLMEDKIYSWKKKSVNHHVYFPISLLFFILCAAFITGMNFNPFIYFRF